jgi:hypothetical protein
VKQHIKKQNEIIKDLKEQLEKVESGNTGADVKIKEEQLAEIRVCPPSPTDL